MAKAFDSPDNRGYTPDPTKIGTKWIHFRNSDTVYIILGYKFDAERDLWVYIYRECYDYSSSATEYTRSPENFHELVPINKMFKMSRFAETR